MNKQLDNKRESEFSIEFLFSVTLIHISICTCEGTTYREREKRKYLDCNAKLNTRYVHCTMYIICTTYCMSKKNIQTSTLFFHFRHICAIARTDACIYVFMYMFVYVCHFCPLSDVKSGIKSFI